MASKKEISVSVVPWFNAAQFKKVYEYLFSDEITKKRWAVDTISVWETRCRPSLPTAIEATYVLTSAVIQDVLWTNKTTLIHHVDLQGIYGSAITRFVSLIADANKNPGCPSYSIAEIAKSIGIPSFIVDIRNEWCHSVRPSLSVLRLATQSALKYLKESYWVKEAARVNNYVKQPIDASELMKLFVDFTDFHQDTIKGTKVKIIETGGEKKYTPEYKELLRRLEKHLQMDKRLFVKVLISDGIFIPNDQAVKLALEDNVYKLFDTEYALVDDDDDDDDDDDEMQEEIDYLKKVTTAETLEFESKNFPELPDYYEDLWHPVIKFLNNCDAVPLFMEELLKTQGNRTVVGQKLLIAWMLKILRIHGLQPCETSSRRLKKIFRGRGIIPNWLRVLHSALINPCKYTLVLLPLILNQCHLKTEEAHRIIGLISLKLGMVPIENRKKNYWKLYHTASDLKEALEYQRNNVGREKQRKRMKQNKKNENIWEPCPDDCYKDWPVGHIVNAVKDSEDDDDEEEVEKGIFQYISGMEITSGCAMLSSNKNEVDDYDDEDATCKMNEEPDLNKIMQEIDRRETVLLKRSG